MVITDNEQDYSPEKCQMVIYLLLIIKSHYGKQTVTAIITMHSSNGLIRLECKWKLFLRQTAQESLKEMKAKQINVDRIC